MEICHIITISSYNGSNVYWIQTSCDIFTKYQMVQMVWQLWTLKNLCDFALYAFNSVAVYLSCWPLLPNDKDTQLFCINISCVTLILSDSLYWHGIYQIELDGLHNWSICSLNWKCWEATSQECLIQISRGYWVTAVNRLYHNITLCFSHTTERCQPRLT